MTNSSVHNKTLSARQRRALPLLLSARNVTEGCRFARIGRDVFYQWMKQEAFRNAYDEQSAELVQESIYNLKLAAGRAVEVLTSLMDNRSPMIRYRAACRIQDSIDKLFIDNLEQRLSKLEAEMGVDDTDGYKR